MDNCPKCSKHVSKKDSYCNNCNAPLYNSIFDNLSKQDIKLIKENKLSPLPPSIFASMIFDLNIPYYNDAIEKHRGKPHLFNLLVFKTFIWYDQSFCWIKKKEGLENLLLLEKQFKNAMLFKLIDGLLFKDIVPIPPKGLLGQGYVLFKKFKEATLLNPKDGSFELASIVYNNSDIDEGILLHMEQTSVFEACRNGMFNDYFIIEEKDWKLERSIDDFSEEDLKKYNISNQ